MSEEEPEVRAEPCDEVPEGVHVWIREELVEGESD